VDATTRGGEAGLVWRFAEHWKLDTSLAYVRGENDTDARPLAQLPPLESRLAIAYEHAALVRRRPAARSSAEQDRIAVNQGNIVGQDLGPSDGFTVCSLHASWKPTARARLSAGVDNLFDRNLRRAHQPRRQRRGRLRPDHPGQRTRPHPVGEVGFRPLNFTRPRESSVRFPAAARRLAGDANSGEFVWIKTHEITEHDVGPLTRPAG
jgi:iron complex outermembrane receptor protein